MKLTLRAAHYIPQGVELTLPFEKNLMESDEPLECAIHMDNMDQCPKEIERRRARAAQTVPESVPDANNRMDNTEEEPEVVGRRRGAQIVPDAVIYQDDMEKRTEEVERLRRRGAQVLEIVLDARNHIKICYDCGGEILEPVLDPEETERLREAKNRRREIRKRRRGEEKRRE